MIGCPRAMLTVDLCDVGVAAAAHDERLTRHLVLRLLLQRCLELLHRHRLTLCKAGGRRMECKRGRGGSGGEETYFFDADYQLKRWRKSAEVSANGHRHCLPWNWQGATSSSRQLPSFTVPTPWPSHPAASWQLPSPRWPHHPQAAVHSSEAALRQVAKRAAGT